MDDRHHDGDCEKKNYKTNLLAAHLLKNSDSLTYSVSCCLFDSVVTLAVCETAEISPALFKPLTREDYRIQKTPRQLKNGEKA